MAKVNRVSSAENDMLASPTYYDHLELWQDKSKAFTQEVTATSKPGTQLEWIIGGFYLRQHALQKIDERSSTPASTAPNFGAGPKPSRRRSSTVTNTYSRWP